MLSMYICWESVCAHACTCARDRDVSGKKNTNTPTLGHSIASGTQRAAPNLCLLLCEVRLSTSGTAEASYYLFGRDYFE